MPDNVKFIQNIVGSILDRIESFKNIFNWSVPSKTYYIYLAVLIFWILTVIIPGRYIILVCGLFDFFYVFMPQPEDSPLVTKFNNLMEAVPNDDDLEQVYSWQRKHFVKQHAEKERKRLKNTKLRIMLECIWDGNVHLKNYGSGHTASAALQWEAVYIVLQGHRFVWWTSETDFDEGKPPSDQLLLFGHAGVTHASPVDIREIGDDSRLMCIFGKDLHGNPSKITLLCNDLMSCKTLTAAANKAIITYS